MRIYRQLLTNESACDEYLTTISRKFPCHQVTNCCRYSGLCMVETKITRHENAEHLPPPCSEHTSVVSLLVRLDEKFTTYIENNTTAMHDVKCLIERMVAVEEHNNTDAMRLDRLEKNMDLLTGKIGHIYSIATYTAAVITLAATVWGTLHDFIK
jgi:hypothetical protein